MENSLIELTNIELISIKLINYYWMRFKWKVVKDDVYYEFMDKYRKMINDLGYSFGIKENYLDVQCGSKHFFIDDTYLSKELLNKDKL